MVFCDLSHPTKKVRFQKGFRIIWQNPLKMVLNVLPIINIKCKIKLIDVKSKSSGLKWEKIVFGYHLLKSSRLKCEKKILVTTN